MDIQRIQYFNGTFYIVVCLCIYELVQLKVPFYENNIRSLCMDCCPSVYTEVCGY